MTTNQKCAILAFESSVASFAQGTINEREAIRMVTNEMNALNISEGQFGSYAQVNAPRRVEDYVSGLRTIKDKAILDYVLYNSFGIAKMGGSEKALGYHLHVFKQLGYTEDEILNVIKKINSLGQQFGL